MVTASENDERSSAERPTELDPERERLKFLARLAGGLAHEIKNPLSTMSINLTLLEEDLERAAATGDAPAGPREARIAKRVTTLKREVERLEGIVREFLAFARRSEVNRAPLDLGHLVQDTADFVEPENDSAGIRQHVDIETGLPLVLVDAGQIRQALMNLFGNAREAMPDGGELLVRVQRVGKDAIVSVTDTGVGMSPEQMERCFDVYWSNKKGGTGLGLATTRHIVEDHGGRMHVVSEPGRGTSFDFSLPLAVELTRGVEHSAAPATGGGA
jgi:two-component system, NtrC family, sensor histidine kinase HydH